MYNLYYLELSNLNNESNDANSFSYQIKRQRIGVCNLSLPYEKLSFSKMLLRIYFRFITHGNVWIYYVCDKDKIIHTSYLLGKCYKFPFMSKEDYEIGPCVTDKKYRGKGIYPTVIRHIITDIKDKASTIYMVCEENNISSIRGIMKSGFIKKSYVLSKNIIKAYKRK